jgi:hypothetical protein
VGSRWSDAAEPKIHDGPGVTRRDAHFVQGETRELCAMAAQSVTMPATGTQAALPMLPCHTAEEHSSCRGEGLPGWLETLGQSLDGRCFDVGMLKRVWM